MAKSGSSCLPRSGTSCAATRISAPPVSSQCWISQTTVSVSRKARSQASTRIGPEARRSTVMIPPSGPWSGRSSSKNSTAPPRLPCPERPTTKRGKPVGVHARVILGRKRAALSWPKRLLLPPARIAIVKSLCLPLLKACWGSERFARLFCRGRAGMDTGKVLFHEELDVLSG